MTDQQPDARLRPPEPWGDRPSEVAASNPTRRSPLTGRPRVSLVQQIDTAPLVERWRLTYGIDIRSELHGLAAVDVLRCDDTGLIYFRPEAVAGSPALYRALQSAIEYYPGLKWEHHTALDDARGAGTLLEVGCGSGAFVAAARQRGIDARGAEINPDAVRSARTRGLPVSLASLEQRGAAGERYEVVCAFQVLEHVPHPGEFLRRSLDLLAPGGSLILSVPNADGLLRHYDELLDLPPHHMSRWSRSTFESLPRWLPVRLARWAAEPLAREHVGVCVAAYAQVVRAAGGPRATLANRYTRAMARRLLLLGLRHLVTGHTMYARFVKTDDGTG